MSDENVEVVRNALEPFAATDEFLGVLALLHQSGKPHGSNSAVRLDYGLLHTLDGGLIRRIEAYATSEAARQAAGLSA